LSNEVKVEKLVEQIFAGHEVTNAEVEKFYKDNKAQFATPERVQVSHILFDVNPDTIKRNIVEGDKEAKISSNDIEAKVQEEINKKEAMARDLAQQLSKNPKQFAEYAKKYSDDTASAEKGGDLGFITRDSVVKEFGDVAFTQKVGTVSPLVKTQFGYHIIYVKDKSAGGTQSLATIKNDLLAYLSQKKKYDTFQKYLDGLKNSAKIEYVDKTLEPEALQKQIQEAAKKQQEKQDKEAQKRVKKIELPKEQQEQPQEQSQK